MCRKWIETCRVLHCNAHPQVLEQVIYCCSSSRNIAFSTQRCLPEPWNVGALRWSAPTRRSFRLLAKRTRIALWLARFLGFRAHSVTSTPICLCARSFLFTSSVPERRQPSPVTSGLTYSFAFFQSFGLLPYPSTTHNHLRRLATVTRRQATVPSPPYPSPYPPSQRVLWRHCRQMNLQIHRTLRTQVRYASFPCARRDEHCAD
jgi:hypothetical protein